jgi:hypothetical protein
MMARIWVEAIAFTSFATRPMCRRVRRSPQQKCDPTVTCNVILQSLTI